MIPALLGSDSEIRQTHRELADERACFFALPSPSECASTLVEFGTRPAHAARDQRRWAKVEFSDSLARHAPVSASTSLQNTQKTAPDGPHRSSDHNP
jgi:hypothetical protein